MTVYRGLNLPDFDESLAFLTVGRRMRFPSFLSTTLNKEKSFEGNVVIKIHVNDGLWNACKIKHISLFPEEDEVLFPPWSAFEVISIVIDGGAAKVEMKAWDNLEAMSDRAFNEDCVTFKSMQEGHGGGSIWDISQGLSSLSVPTRYQVTWTCGGGLNYRKSPDWDDCESTIAPANSFVEGILPNTWCHVTNV
jgi:hypothetical protein